MDQASPASQPDPAEIRRAILVLTARRGLGKSICPSEVARLVAGPNGDWRSLMPAVREAAMELSRAGQIVVSQGGTAVDPDADIGSLRGPIRLAVSGLGEQS